MLPKTFVKRCPKMSYEYIAKNPPVKVGSSSRKWVFSSMCPRPDLNRHGLFSQRILSPSCLPIPSPGQLLCINRTRPADLRPNWDVDSRRRPDSNRRITVLQTAPLNHLGTTPLKEFYHPNLQK